ncbi:MAG TPA: hypothetical protein DEF39_10120 [Hungateiclostridium thermocellum]|uniref:Ricin B lectin n=1 Tax=Acetivibrio thermocellus (strain ATCC 27405 / DSM 1237 / JCM 9322 / NBRC 103400 / NCIMB 10682 / NRRL B-4536 / VPI 7372) TaxID=203119 RepID=A3DD67_ACET2|nr:RICIN domain-containing protein [Acetivibrio thermocellus]ABN51896.1 Ricin B lectin [Acetivibrio thermocellus ATCC 27405]HBW27596.1 hypothetical protein [Acetivibrio thermocellus]
MVKKNVGLRFLSILILMALLIGNVQSFNVAAAEGVIVNGTQFKDTSGNVIHAHGGGMLKHGDYYYWYGEYRDDSNLFLGVSCYRSKDLVNWEYRGEVLSRNSAPELNHCNIERPKVMYNASTGEFVMWMHWENGINYGQARAAVAYSKTPDGKFTYIRSFRPMQDTGVMDHGLPGYMSRDCNVFVDTDGKGYFISAANENMDLHLYELTPDYKNIASLKAKLFVGQQREAPCLIKRNGYYYLITSGCTGWNPNQAKYAYSKDLASGWSQLYNLGNSTTYRSQPTFIIPVQGSSGTSYLYMGDRWAGAWGGKVNDSQYVWLPLNFISDTTLELPYYDSVKIDASSGIISEYIPDTTRYKLVNKNSGKVLDVLDGSVDNAAQIVQWTDNGSLSQQWYLVDVGGGYKKIVNVKSGRALDVKDESKEDGGVLIQYTSNGGYNQHWKFTDIGDGYYKISSRHCGKLIDVRKWSTEDGGIIQQWSDAGGTNQHWKLVLVSSPEPSPSPSPQVVKGDVNGDLKVNSTDFSMLRRYLLKTIDNFPTENGKQAADLNGDGRINSSDLTMLKRYLLMEVDL